MDPDFDPAGPTMSSSLQSVTTNREVFNAKELNDSILGVNLSSQNSELLSFYHKREHESMYVLLKIRLKVENLFIVIMWKGSLLI